MNVISLSSARVRTKQPVQPPLALVTRLPDADRANIADDAEDRVRMRQNFAAGIAIICIVVLGAWLLEGLRAYSRVQMCLEAGHRNCIPVDHKYQPSRFNSAQ